jgi:ATP-binding cassette subfamily C protein
MTAASSLPGFRDADHADSAVRQRESLVTKTLVAYIRTLLEVGRLRLAGALALMLLLSLTEGVGLALLLPLLQVAGLDLGAQGSLGRYERTIAGAIQALGLHPSLLVLLIVFAGLVGARAVLGQWQNVTFYSIQQSFGLLLRRRLYHAIANARWLFVSRLHSADLTHALTAEVERAEVAGSQLLGLVSRLLLLALYLAVALVVSAPTTALVVGCGILLVLMLRRRTRLLHDAGADFSRRTRDLYAAAVEHLQGLKAARMYSAQERNFESFANVSAEVARSGVEIMRQGAAVGTLFELGSVAILAVLIYVALRMLEVAPFAVLLLLGMFVRVTPSVMLCHHLYRELVQAMPAFENVMGLTARCAAEAEPAGAPPAALEFAGALRLERVSFSYQPDKPPAVRELDLVVPAGEFVALVGTSGAGKSTIADLMCGLLVPAAGRVTIDGAVLDQERARAWRAQVGYVAQDTHLFRGTVRDNLLWARPEAGEAELRAALALAEAAAFVDALPQGLDTPIGERGATISQGERQRLALARALLRRPRLLILDEATNSLDAHTEQRILTTVEALRGETTIVMIAHRIAAVRYAGLIYVIEGGAVAESGNWDELCAREHGRLHAMCLSQGIAPAPLAAPPPQVALRRA